MVDECERSRSAVLFAALTHPLRGGPPASSKGEVGGVAAGLAAAAEENPPAAFSNIFSNSRIHPLEPLKSMTN